MSDIAESMVAASICWDMENVTTISWDHLASETKKDKILSVLLNVLTTCSDDEVEIDPCLRDYAKYFDSLYVSDGVIL